ncbi:MAG: mannose-1-phosphate guanylyltransferase [Chlorobi bacterium]|nr:mannose-1-phosphate guanylyltransferase [Chlorobiota bacterium]
MNKNYYCVIMAGGTGTRFWPLSKTRKPKQFLDILGTGKSLLRQTYERFARICPPENIYVVTNEIYTELTKEQLPELKYSQILSEPLKRNTAPCIAYSNLKIKSENPDALIVTAPSDHLVLNETEFIKIIRKSFDFVEQNNCLLTLGIKPSRPETGYGYIQKDDKNPENFPEIFKVKSFTEKPDRKTAEMFLESGEFLWNSGIFIWSLKSINKAFKSYLPDIFKLFSDTEKINTPEKEKNYINEVYSVCESISIDNGIMEHADNVYVLPSDFGWSDLGTWDSLYDNGKKDENGNVLNSDKILCYDTENSVINISGDKLLVVEGLKDYLIAEADNAILICRRDNEKRIRDFVKDVEEKTNGEFI